MNVNATFAAKIITNDFVKQNSCIKLLLSAENATKMKYMSIGLA